MKVNNVNGPCGLVLTSAFGPVATARSCDIGQALSNQAGTLTAQLLGGPVHATLGLSDDVSYKGTKSYSPIPCNTKNVAELFPPLVTKCGRGGLTEYVSPGPSRNSSLGSRSKSLICPSIT